ncbi:hypothetical protein HLI18_18580 [Rhizobium laguerreae]|uniref:type IV toxin-antitoxin system AbiEi family antitoxin n=1 Tax=Rhizobium laguerreae TaxID=1076926 RepID=UPI0014791213|nr:type IV toxin-antitoxin system AbiEi family antitoxin [Rhizobium laguerreae]NNG71900.1 hypothetical protein [Rhizobium laguerreae]
MLKSPIPLKKLEEQAALAVKELLQHVPALQVHGAELINGPDVGVDIVARFTHHSRQHVLACEVKSMGQPRHVRAALLQLRRVAENFIPRATPVFIAPFLSQEAQALCREYEVGYLDLMGNARIALDGIYIERQVADKPRAFQRSFKSVFKPKSAQVLRILLGDPGRAWKVVDLAEASAVSLGHVSNVRTELVDREWAEVTDDGLRLARPDDLLDAWREVYEAPKGERLTFYTTLHGSILESATREVLNVGSNAPRSVFASFSAAQWLAPYGRVSTQYFYADDAGAKRLRDSLKLSPATAGSNVVITVLAEEGPFLDTIAPAPGIVCTSPVQTYLDLAIAGERGAEAADHLRKERLSWQT